MVKCPACEQDVNEDFGMVNCPHCKAVFMIDYAGNIQYGTEEEEVAYDDVTQDEDLIPEESVIQNEDFIQSEDVILSEAKDLNDSDFQEDFNDEIQEYDFPEPEEMSAMVEEDPIIEEPIEETEEVIQNEDVIENDSAIQSEDVIESDSVILSEAKDLEEEPMESSFEEDEEEDFAPEPETHPIPDTRPVDVTEFANSEESSLEDGEYLYTIVVSRIDSKELKDDLKYVLMDDKLKLNYHEHLRNIASGSVTIPDLHPIKAKRIVEQLQFFDLEVRWIQKRVIIEEPLVEDITLSEAKGLYEEEPIDE